MENTQLNQTNPVNGYPRMASFQSRFIALIIDSLILAVIVWPLSFFFGIISGMAASINSADSYAGLGFANIFSTFFSYIISAIYYGWFYVNKGQSLGKMAVKIKVVKTDLRYLTWGEAILRDVLFKILSSIPMYLGFFWYFKNQKRQTWHDSLANTYVVETDPNGNLYMDGQQNYQSNNLKTFGFPVGCCLAYIIILGIVIWAMITFASNKSFYPSSNQKNTFEYNKTLEKNYNTNDNINDLDESQEDVYRKLEEEYRNYNNTDTLSN